MPRPRTVADADILAAAAAVVGRVGPSHVTLALVARECALSPATLVQRFGSKRELLLALARNGDPRGTRRAPAPASTNGRRRRDDASLDAIRDYLVELAALANTPDEMANHLAFLQLDLTDPEFHAITRERMAEQDRHLTRLVRRAVASGALPASVDAAKLARALITAANGSLLRWAIYRTGTARRWLARDVDFVLDAARTAPRR